MSPKSRLEAVYAKRLDALVRDLPSAAGGDVEAVHRTRVASRRVREALPICGEDSSRVKKARRRTRDLTRALGAVRELDVALELLAGRPATSPARRAALELLRAEVGQEREHRRQVMLDELGAIKPDKLVRRITAAVEELPAEAEPRWRRSLSARLARRVARLRTSLDHAGALYLPDRLHAVRIALKKLRYGLEITGDLRLASTGSAVKTLKGVQDALGSLHDLEVLNAHVRRVQESVPTARGDLRAELDGLGHEIEDECRSLHATFLAARARLLRVADFTSAICGRLADEPLLATSSRRPWRRARPA
jgi:CHAD domain-containing protein